VRTQLHLPGELVAHLKMLDLPPDCFAAVARLFRSSRSSCWAAVMELAGREQQLLWLLETEPIYAPDDSYRGSNWAAGAAEAPAARGQWAAAALVGLKAKPVAQPVAQPEARPEGGVDALLLLAGASEVSGWLCQVAAAGAA
jgi:hypothetical protein